MKYIAHIDMDCFFASVEELLNPKLKNKPIIVAGRNKRSVVSSANYLARKDGVKAAMPLFMATKICPKVIVVLPHFYKYEEYSEKFINLIEKKFSKMVEHLSIDECFVDITNLVNKNTSPIDVCNNIQRQIKQHIGLPCSIGIANNKFLAKMASDLKKPMGITTLWNSEIKNKLWPLPIHNMLWIGKRTAQLLVENNIKTIGDIANENNKDLLKNLLDKNWETHYLHANGIGDDQIDLSINIPKSISQSETFLNDTNDFNEIKIKLIELTNNVIWTLKQQKMLVKTISVQIKTIDFKLHNKSFTLQNYIDDKEDILLYAGKIFSDNFTNKTIRLIGVTLSNLIEKHKLNINSELFDDYWNQSNAKNKEFTTLVESINDSLNADLISIAKDKLT
ncbi:MAG: DNA polymerase IV [Mycoplasmataceae bacterium]|nr:DNA polymerase IV [Mycoplasmataceae bacterium]